MSKVALLTFLAACTPLSFAGDEPSRPDAPPSRKLLNKADLGPWTEVGYGGQGIVEVIDEVLILGAGDPITAVKWGGKLGDGPKDFPKTNYRLSFEARRTLGLDFFATVTFPVGDDVCSLVVGGWGGGLTGLSSLNGDDAANNDTTDYTPFENNKWYQFEISVTPEEIRAFQDGKSMFPAVKVEDYDIGIRVEMEPCKPVGIASYLCTGEIRNLRLKRIDRSQPQESEKRISSE